MSDHATIRPTLVLAVVLGVTEHECTVGDHAGRRAVGFAPSFPRPRIERIVPGNLVAVARLPLDQELVVWRWYDAVVLDEVENGVRLWEPFHGEVVARRRPGWHPVVPGSRAYVSAGLPGADWWVCGAVTPDPSDAKVDLDAVIAFYDEHDLWGSLGVATVP
jgi:hypothetical protein